MIASAPAESFTVLPSKSDEGKPIFSVLVKRTYDIRLGQPCRRAERVNPLTQVDVYYDHGDPESSTVRCETDLIPFKIATDVVVIGSAHAPDGKPVTAMEVGVEVGGRRKVIRVIGDRQCVYRSLGAPAFTDPVPFTAMEIRYDRAYGGQDLHSNPDLPFYYPRNQMGKGLAVKNVREAVHGLALPNFEDPQDLLTPERVVLGERHRWNQQPLPQGFGWFQRTWYPRCSFVGAIPGDVALEEPMREELLGWVPKGQVALARQFKLPGFDVRFNNGASPGLIVPHLVGGETVRLTNLLPEGQLTLSLPKDTPRIMLDIGLGENELKPVLHTVCVRMADWQVDLVWRGAHEYPGLDWLPEMKRMVTKVE
jgi:hypothetical protein